jgi:diguanylate cyclase (GGDEF)-like protein
MNHLPLSGKKRKSSAFIAHFVTLCSAWMLACLPVRAQQYSFQYFGLDQGLTNLTAKSLFQDRIGFIWVATENGIFRYEGERFRKFGEKEGLPPSVNASIGEAPDGSVLVGKPLGLFRLKSDRFEPVQLGHKGAGVWSYNGIAPDGPRTWVATDAGLLSITVGTDGGLVAQPGPQAPSDSLLRAQSVLVGGGSVWWGCGNSLCQYSGGRVTVRGAESGVDAAPVASITLDRSGNLWISQKRHLRVLYSGASRFENPEPAIPVVSPGAPQVDSEGRLLVPTNEGLAIREGSTVRIAGRSSGILPPVYSVLQDRGGSVWLGFAGRGLAKWLGYGLWESFSAVSGLSGETVYEILPRADGTVWIGGEAGLFRGHAVNGVWTWTFVKSVGAIPVHAVQPAADGSIWLGSDSSGVGRLDPKTERVQWFSTKDGLDGQNFWAVLIDRSGAIWAGSDKGLFRSDPGPTRFRRVEQAVTSDATLSRIFALIQAPNGDVWAGSATGVWRYSNGAWIHYTTAQGLRDKTVLALAAAENGDLWIGYRLTGVITRLRVSGTAAKFDHFEPPAGQPMNITYFLGFDQRGHLWAGTNLGVLTRDQNGRWDQYDHRDGLIWDDCDLHSFALDPDGHVWIGTSAGLSHFLPDAVRPRTEAPRTVFTSVIRGRNEMDVARPFSFAYSSDPLITRFTSLHFGRDRDILFRYRLNPVSTTWRETSDRELQFPALPPGKYQLEVEARDTRSGWSGIPASIDFEVIAPLWRRWWFLTAVIVGCALLVGYILRRRNARQEAIRSALESAVLERTKELSHQYRHDVLTGLPNRLLFGEQLQRELLTAHRQKVCVGVLFIDLDRFKRINDTWGHHTGDEFLKRIADRLLSGLRRGETIARIGGDEFIVLIPGLQNRNDAALRGRELQRVLDDPIGIEGKNVFATMSVGIATFPDDALEAGALMAAADAAMYSAKGSGKNQVRVFEPDMKEAASRPQNIEDRLRDALRNDGFRLRYQPQCALDGRILGFEALLRIEGLEDQLGPAEFIPVAEESGLIFEMGAWVLREACRQLKEWQRLGLANVRVSVNVSPMQLAHDDFEPMLLSILSESGLDPAFLDLELTETALVKNTGDSAGLLKRCRERGIRVALDDFGTGFSPMHYLHQLPVDVVKIDRVFIRDLDGNPSSAPLVEGMVRLARILGLKIVAEGVETTAQFDVLREIGFDMAQGNLLAPPSTASEAEELLRARSLYPGEASELLRVHA